MSHEADMSDKIDLVNKLIQLALHNPNEEEARSAALKVVRLISEHNLEVRERSDPKPTSPTFQDIIESIKRSEMWKREAEQNNWSPFYSPRRAR